MTIGMFAQRIQPFETLPSIPTISETEGRQGKIPYRKVRNRGATSAKKMNQSTP